MDLSDPTDREALALFSALEDTPWQRRTSLAFRENEHALARMLGLTDEWWRGGSVLDRSKKPRMPSHLCAYADWFRIRRVRETLLREAKKLRQQQAAE